MHAAVPSFLYPLLFFIIKPNTHAVLLYNTGKRGSVSATAGRENNKENRQAGDAVSVNGNSNTASQTDLQSAENNSTENSRQATPPPGNDSGNSGTTTAQNTSGNAAAASPNSASLLVLEDDDELVPASEYGRVAALNGQQDTLDAIRSVAQEIVRKKQAYYHHRGSSYLTYPHDLALAHAQWNPATKNLDAALSQHRTYLQEVAALDENELFMELIRDVGEWWTWLFSSSYFLISAVHIRWEIPSSKCSRSSTYYRIGKGIL